LFISFFLNFQVHKNVKATAGHSDGDIHFYAVVGWSLPAEIADQLAHVIKTNPRGGTWADIADRFEFQKAEELARASRERLLTCFLHMTRLSACGRSPAPVHTVSDVLRRATVSRAALGLPRRKVADAAAAGGNEEEDDHERELDAVIFYAGAAPTQTAGPGVLVMTASDPTRTIVW